MADAKTKSGYLPSLDGWRCLAILGVMWTHDARRVVFGHKTAYYQGMGGYGVQLFFAISGILIAWRILQDEQKTGHFSLKAFYVRRFFRIQPPQWVYLSVVALLMGVGAIHAQWKYWWGALLLYENFLWHNFDIVHIVPASYLVGHFWTLAAEEHFYLAISLFFFLVKRRRATAMGLLLLALLVGQRLAKSHGLFSPDYSDRRTYWVIQSLMFASFVAILLRKPAFRAAVDRWLKPWVAFLLTAVLMFAHHIEAYGFRELTPRASLGMDSIILFYCFTMWVVASMTHPQSWTTRFLELKPLRFVGRISYSLYLWHILFFGGGAPAWCSWHLLTWLNGEPTRYVCALVFATLSYYFIEKPMIRVGHRLAPPATPGHRDLAVAPEAAPSAVLPEPAR